MNRLSLALLLALAAPAAADRAQVEAGEAAFRKCASCHKIGPGAKHATGPHLNGVFGRSAGALEDFRYSPDIVRMGNDGLVWDYETLHLYLENPKTLVSGTRMNFRGVKEEAERAAIIAFLRAYSDKPSDIPESAPTNPGGDPEVAAAILAIEGDPDYGEYLSGECVTCHQVDGADEGIPSITGWNEDDFVTALHAYRAKHRANAAMQLVAARLSDEEIAGLAAFFAKID